jgi:hypothetical protein
MRKAMLFTTLLILGACAKKDETPAADTTAAAPAAAPAMADSAAPMVDSAAKDTTKM